MKYIIVDDEPLAREGLRALADQMPVLQNEGTFSNAVTAAGFLAENKVDLVFLDINMPGMDGIEFAKTISGQTLIVFTTAHPDYALESYDLEAIDYLLKPVNAERFQRAVQKAQVYSGLLHQEEKDTPIEEVTPEFIFIKSERQFVKLFISDILYIEGLKDYVVINTEKEKYITLMNIKTIHQKLPQHIFARVNKSCLVNIHHILSFDNHMIRLKTTGVPLGSTYRDTFLESYIKRNLVIR